MLCSKLGGLCTALYYTILRTTAAVVSGMSITSGRLVTAALHLLLSGKQCKEKRRVPFERDSMLNLTPGSNRLGVDPLNGDRVRCVPLIEPGLMGS